MQQAQRPRKARQQYLRLAKKDIWGSLPETQRESCHQLLAEALCEVIRTESRERSNHER